MPQELSGLQISNQRKSREGKRPSSSSLMNRLPPLAPPLSRGGMGVGREHSFLVPVWSSWDCHDYGESISGLITMSAFHFEMSHFHKFLFFFCLQRVCPGVIKLLSPLGRLRVVCHHCFIVWGMSCASVARFSCSASLLGFVIKQTPAFLQGSPMLFFLLTMP